MKTKFTKWQLKFFIAIMTSWTAFELFYNKQFNKKMFDQYLGRFFPISDKPSGSEKQKEKIKRLMRILRNEVVEESHNKKYTIGAIIDINILFIAIEKAKKIFVNYNMYETIDQGLVSLFFYDKNNIKNTHLLSPIGESIISFINDFKHMEYKFNTNDTIILKNIFLSHVDDDHFNTSRIITYHIFREYLNLISTKNKMNIGIEFEYDHPDNEIMYISDIDVVLCKDLVSISSGYDNHEDRYNHNNKKYPNTKITYSEFKKTDRLNEDRLRLNGYKGLQSLYKYLIYLNKTGFASKNSSIHIHIDCLYDESFNINNKTYDYYKSTSSLYKYIKRVRYPKFLDLIYLEKNEKIFNKNGYITSNVEDIIQSTIIRNSLHTLEFRAFKTSFQYEDVVMYILIACYIVRHIKKGTKIDENIIKTIIKANGIVKKNKN